MSFKVDDGRADHPSKEAAKSSSFIMAAAKHPHFEAKKSTMADSHEDKFHSNVWLRPKFLLVEKPGIRSRLKQVCPTLARVAGATCSKLVPQPQGGW